MMEDAAHPFDVRGENVAERFDGDPTKWAFGKLRPFSYDLIMIDPPWPTEMRSKKGEGKSHTRHYGSMSFEEIAALPVGQLASEHSGLFVWGVWPHMLYGGDPKKHYRDFNAGRSPIGECIHRWGARVVSGGNWQKLTKNGKKAFGPGYRVRSSSEPFILAIFGNPKNSKSMRNSIDGLRRGHSEKPEEAYAWCEKWMPKARCVELFSRTSRPNWDTWGYEAGKFEATVTLGARQ